MWADFRAGTGVDAPYDSFGFGGDDTPELRNELAWLVRDGPKRATAGLLDDYEADGDPIPAVGDYFVVTDAAGDAVTIIRTTWLDIVRFVDVDEQFAWDEGEGDRTLGWWREAHARFFAASGHAVNDDTKVVLERFDKVWPL